MKHLLPIVCFTVARLAVASAVHAAPSQPNIVILYADDMGVGDVAAANPESKIPTPNLDMLCREGTRFTDAHSSSGICTPSRYALLHGRYHWRKLHGIVQAFDQPILDAERTTLAEMLAAKGYRTACIGKWHLGWDWQAVRRPGVEPTKVNGRDVYPPEAFDWAKPIPGGPLDHGFQTYFGDDVPNFPPYAWFEDDRIIEPPTRQLVLAGDPAEGHWECRPGPTVEGWDFSMVMPDLTKRAVEWIGRQQRGKPFFLYFPFTAPHAPIVPTKAFTGASQAGGYGDFVVQMDHAVGEVLRALEAAGVADDTLVIFTADNGPEGYARDRVKRYGHHSAGPLRGLKRDIYEGGHRVPFMARWPGHVPAGRVEDGLVSQIDLFRTIAGLVGGDIPEGSAEDSLDQRPCLLGTGPSARDTLIHNTRPTGFAIRRGDWVLIDRNCRGIAEQVPAEDKRDGSGPSGKPVPPGKAAPPELYNLKEDLAQQHDRAAAEPQRAADMQRELRRSLDDAPQASAARLIVPVVLRAEANPAIFHQPFRIEVNGKPFDTGLTGHAGPCVFDVNGDGLDDLVVGGYSGTFRILLKRGTGGKPQYADGGVIEAGGVPAKVRIYCCIAAQPRFCDLDGDGLDDMLANSYDPGHCHFFKGQTDGGFADGVELMDASGAPVRAYPHEEDKSLSFGAFFAPVDWDDDGDLDLLIGCGDGGLKRRLNQGTAQAPEFAADDIVMLDAAGDPLRVPGKHFCPSVADWDGDGRWDILSGSIEGGVWWFRNVGERGAPRFAAAACLVDPPSVPFSLSTRPVPGQRTQAVVTDHDGDGRLDLIVGDFRLEYVCKPDLSPEEIHACETLFASFSAARQAHERKAKELEDEALDGSEENAELERTRSAFEEYIRPRLRQRYRYKVLVEDGSMEEREDLYLARGNAWVYLRR